MNRPRRPPLVPSRLIRMPGWASVTRTSDTLRHAISIGRIPQWDVADRLRKALREAHMSTEEMADYLDVSRRSIGNWLSGRIKPSTRTMRLWALRTGVQYEWLCHDDFTPCGPGTPVDLHEHKVITGRYRNEPSFRTIPQSFLAPAA